MNGEDGRVQATFDMLGIPYTGSGYLGAAIAMDKMLTKEMIKDKGVRTPAWKTFHAGAITSDEDLKQTAEKIASEIEAPCVVKTPTGGSSVGVYIVTSQDAVRPAVEKCLSFGPDVLVEQMIEGREFTCAVLGDRALPSVEIVPKVDFYNYENKYKAGATEEICPGRCTPESPHLFPQRFHRRQVRQRVVFGSQHTARHDPYQPCAAGGSRSGHLL